MKRDINLLKVQDTNIKNASKNKMIALITGILIFILILALAFVYVYKSNQLSEIDLKIKYLDNSILSIKNKTEKFNKIDKLKYDIDLLNKDTDARSELLRNFRGIVGGIEYGPIESVLFDPNEKVLNNGENLTKPRNEKDVNKASYVMFKNKSVDLSTYTIDINSDVSFIFPAYIDHPGNKPDPIGSEDSIVKKYYNYLKQSLFEFLKNELPKNKTNLNIEFTEEDSQMIIKSNGDVILSLSPFVTNLKPTNYVEAKDGKNEKGDLKIAFNSKLKLSINKLYYRDIIKAINETYFK